MTKKRQKEKSAAVAQKRINTKPAERGLGPGGGGWNIAQAAAWSGIGEGNLRLMAKRTIETGDKSLFPCYLIGRRRFLIPRQGFMDWFNRRTETSAERGAG